MFHFNRFFYLLLFLFFGFYFGLSAALASDIKQEFNIWNELENTNMALKKMNSSSVKKVVVGDRCYLNKNVTNTLDNFPDFFQSLLKEESVTLPVHKGGRHTHKVIAYQYVSQDMIDCMEVGDFGVSLLSCPQKIEENSWCVYNVRAEKGNKKMDYLLALCLSPLRNDN